MAETIGLITGKFYPPHLGHSYLIHYASGQVDHLIVVVFSRTDDSIPGSLRTQWLCRLHPGVEVRHVVADFRDPVDLNDLEAWDFWTRTIREASPRQPDVIFTSEDYGDELARRLGTRHIVVDKARTHVPISGSQIRANPSAHLEFLAPCVRDYYARLSLHDEC